MRAILGSPRFRALGLAIGLALAGATASGAACGCCQQKKGCFDTTDKKSCERLLKGAYVDGWECQSKTCRQKKGEGCASVGVSGPVVSLPAALTLTFQPGSSCQVYFTDTLGGFVFDHAETTMPLAGTLGLLAQPGAMPHLVELRVTDTSGFPHPPFDLGGHQIDILSLDFVDQAIQLDLTKAEDNVGGAYTVRYEVLLDGFFPLTVVEEGQLLATFDPATGAWPAIDFQSELLPFEPPQLAEKAPLSP